MPGTAVFMFKDPGKAPPALVTNLRHNHVLHEHDGRSLSVDTSDAPRVDPASALDVDADRRRRATRWC